VREVQPVCESKSGEICVIRSVEPGLDRDQRAADRRNGITERDEESTRMVRDGLRWRDFLLV
jgi:hypothetical protein